MATAPTKGQRRHYWRAVYALGEAEALAKLTAVEGAADGPPQTDNAVFGFIDDWKKRAKAALDKARNWHDTGKRALKERARRVAVKIAQGVREIYEASPVARAGRTLDNISSAANALQWASLAGASLATLALLWLAWRLLAKG